MDLWWDTSVEVVEFPIRVIGVQRLTQEQEIIKPEHVTGYTMIKSNKEFPKIIWFLWLQGIENAPYVVRKCETSWRVHNPGWKFIVLDEKNIGDYFDVNRVIKKNCKYITPQAMSDIVRINLLNNFGGVWADATCFCNKPLDDWLENYMDMGFFAFDTPGDDRAISSWFLSSRPESKITSRFCEEVNRYWLKNYFSNQNNRIGRFFYNHVHKRIRRSKYESMQFWLLFTVMKTFKVYPYFWFHYLFGLLIGKDKLFRQEWNSMKKYSADIPHVLQKNGLFKPLSKQARIEIDNKQAPLYKLTWKYDETSYVKGCTLEYLLEHA